MKDFFSNFLIFCISGMVEEIFFSVNTECSIRVFQS